MTLLFASIFIKYFKFIAMIFKSTAIKIHLFYLVLFRNKRVNVYRVKVYIGPLK